MQRVLATSRDKHHCTCINQPSPSPTADTASKIVCSIRESNQILRKGDSIRSQEAQEGPANIISTCYLTDTMLSTLLAVFIQAPQHPL